MKVLAWEDDSGQVWLAYVKPEVLKSEYSVDGHDDTFREMGQALEKLADEAASTRCGGQGVVIFYGTAKPVRAPQIGPARQP